MLNLRTTMATACCLLALTACGEPDKVEQASSTGGASTAAQDPAPADDAAASTGSLLETGFGQSDQYVAVVALVKNTSGDVGQTVTVQFNVKDAGGELLASESQVETFSRPDQTMPVQTQVDVSAGKKAAKVEATLLVEDQGAFSTDPFPEIPAGKVTVSRAEYGTGFAAKVEVTNPTAAPLKSPRVSVVCFDKARKIVGGAFTFPDLIPPSGKAAVRMDLLTAGKPASCTAYAVPPVA